MADAPVCITAIGRAVPTHDVHRAFIDWAERQVHGAREQAVFRRMADRSGIAHRWSVLPPTPDGGSPVASGGFYAERMPPTSERMRLYAAHAPALALAAVERLGEGLPEGSPIGSVTHLVVASCTGFVAPGVDQIIADALGLAGVERTLVGFMGCYAAVAALRTARHIVRSEPAARVLVVTVELSTLHLQDDHEIERLLMMLQFGDGAAAALVMADESGIAIERPFSLQLDDSAELIRWAIGDTGFLMHLSGEVPARIQAALRDEAVRAKLLGTLRPSDVGLWAVHAGGRSILDAVEHGLDLPADALAASRGVLSRFGNMSSSTLMFILAELLGQDGGRDGLALAFGPGLAAEGFHFRRL
jgi:alpha-pyrone synthase